MNVTPAAQPDPTDVSQIRFTRYMDNDFTLEYPSTWTVTRSTYTSYYCESKETSRCYQNEIKTIGPFRFDEDAIYTKPTRIVTFTSADGSRKVVAFTSDFADFSTGRYALNPTLGWDQGRVTLNYPDVPGSAVSDYHYSSRGNTMTSGYTVTMPEGSQAYPLAFTMQNFVTIHRDYEFAFLSDNKNIQTYRDLRERILSSITIPDP